MNIIKKLVTLIFLTFSSFAFKSIPLTFEHCVYLLHILPKKEDTAPTSNESYIPPTIDIDANNIAFKFVGFDDPVNCQGNCVMAGIKKGIMMNCICDGSSRHSSKRASFKRASDRLKHYIKFENLSRQLA